MLRNLKSTTEPRRPNKTHLVAEYMSSVDLCLQSLNSEKAVPGTHFSGQGTGGGSRADSARAVGLHFSGAHTLRLVNSCHSSFMPQAVLPGNRPFPLC